MPSERKNLVTFCKKICERAGYFMVLVNEHGTELGNFVLD